MENTFGRFELSNKILRSIEQLGYKDPTTVQEKVIPTALAGHDLLVKSQTGSGKTAAFGIPLCEMVTWGDHKPQVLVLTPTRELAVQVKENIDGIGRAKKIKCVPIFGQQPIRIQIDKLRKRTHMVVGTPGRVMDHIERGTLDTSNIKYLVIDEADEMLNMGFVDLVEDIMGYLPEDKTTMLFSATVPSRIKEISKKYMEEPEIIEIKAQKLITETIDHKICRVRGNSKFKAVVELLETEERGKTIVFCKTKHKVDRTFDWLKERGYRVNRIHGDIDQRKRLRAMEEFKKDKFDILVATDVAARGIDIKGITHVISMDIPMEKESYVHRIGRTGRAGERGKAITLVAEGDGRLLKEIEKYVGFKLELTKLPSQADGAPAFEDKGRPERRKNDERNDRRDRRDRDDRQGREDRRDRRDRNDKRDNRNERNERNDKRDRKDSKKKLRDLDNDTMRIYVSTGKKKGIKEGDIVGTIANIEGVSFKDIENVDMQDNLSYIHIANGKGNKVIEALSGFEMGGSALKVEKAKR